VEKELGDLQMLHIARELGFSETAFLSKLKNIKNDQTWAIRFFSPKMEIPLCGHATLAASKVLFESMKLDEIHFITIKELDLHIRKAGIEILMTFPKYETTSMEPPQKLLEALGLDRIRNSEYNVGTNILLLEISDAEKLESLDPDFNALQNSTNEFNGVLITAKSNDGTFDFYSRYFWPWSGTKEDPVTGGTHTFLAPYWMKRLRKNVVKSFQCSSRTGFMEVEKISDTQLMIKGQAVIMFEGELKI